MERLTRADIHRALEALAAALPPSASMRELWVVGEAAVVLLYDARETTKDVDAFSLDPGTAHLLRTAAAKGRELKARYAFDDLWEADRGPA